MSMLTFFKLIYLYLHVHQISLPLVFTFILYIYRLLIKHILFYNQYAFFQKFHCQHNKNCFTVSMPHDVSLIGHDKWPPLFTPCPCQKFVKIMYLHLHIHHNSLPLAFTYPLCTYQLLMKHIIFHSQYMHIFQTYFSIP
jgi:hypothetical protein